MKRGHAHQCGLSRELGSRVISKTIYFKDTMKMQTIKTGLSGDEDKEIGENGFIFELIIDSVYRGSKYNDTCIAEIKPVK